MHTLRTRSWLPRYTHPTAHAPHCYCILGSADSGETEPHSPARARVASWHGAERARYSCNPEKPKVSGQAMRHSKGRASPTGERAEARHTGHRRDVTATRLPRFFLYTAVVMYATLGTAKECNDHNVCTHLYSCTPIQPKSNHTVMGTAVHHIQLYVGYCDLTMKNAVNDVAVSLAQNAENQKVYSTCIATDRPAARPLRK